MSSLAKAELSQEATTIAIESQEARARLRVALVGGMHVGIGSALMNVIRVAELERQLEPMAVLIEPYRRDRIERFVRRLRSRELI